MPKFVVEYTITKTMSITVEAADDDQAVSIAENKTSEELEEDGDFLKQRIGDFNSHPVEFER